MPARYLFSAGQYERMGELGLSDEDDRVELIEGEIVEMTPIGSRHAACVDRLNRLLTAAVGDRAIVRVQNPSASATAPSPSLTSPCCALDPSSRTSDGPGWAEA